MAHPNRSESWMLPEAKREDLLYAAVLHEVEVFSYPGARHVGELHNSYDISGLCTDPKGDVFVGAGEKILEYAHGGTAPIATIKSKYGLPMQCAIDPATGNLAVIDTFDSGPENIAIYET